jgi:hypothetical protein
MINDSAIAVYFISLRLAQAKDYWKPAAQVNHFEPSGGPNANDCLSNSGEM